MENINLSNLSQSRLMDILHRFSHLHIGIIGDLALDAYWTADMTRAILSRETPHFPRPVVDETYTCGAGANVAVNLKALGIGNVTVFSILGDDWRGDLLRNALEQLNINCSNIITNSNRQTTAYIKPILKGYESQQEDARIDFINTTQLTSELEIELIHGVADNIQSLDALLVADQQEMYGIVTDFVREELNNLAKKHPEKIFVADSRFYIGSFQYMILKPNKQEAILAVEYPEDPETSALENYANIAETLYDRTHCPIYITLGAQGVLIYENEITQYIPAGPTRPPLDPVGAGDAFIAALSSALAAGSDAWEAGIIANLAAAVTVEKLNQTGTASPVEIAERYNLAVMQNL
jgi:rfaE bifunctional protein kinase chain/domain